MTTVSFPFVATENRTPSWFAWDALRSTMLAKPTAKKRRADARMGDEGVRDFTVFRGHIRPGGYNVHDGSYRESAQMLDTFIRGSVSSAP